MLLSKRIIASFFNEAKEAFGLTENWKEAGYILPDGSLLDFSGKKHGGSPNMRSQDHREVEQFMRSKRSTAMMEFMRDGAIRVQYGAGLEIVKAPTEAQYRRIADFAKIHNGDLSIDLSHGIGKKVEPKNDDYYYSNESHSLEFPVGTRPGKIVGDIRKFFS